jgi:hypothetical protein
MKRRCGQFLRACLPCPATFSCILGCTPIFLFHQGVRN